MPTYIEGPTGTIVVPQYDFSWLPTAARQLGDAVTKAAEFKRANDAIKRGDIKKGDLYSALQQQMQSLPDEALAGAKMDKQSLISSVPKPESGRDEPLEQYVKKAGTYYVNIMRSLVGSGALTPDQVRTLSATAPRGVFGGEQAEQLASRAQQQQSRRAITGAAGRAAGAVERHVPPSEQALAGVPPERRAAWAGTAGLSYTQPEPRTQEQLAGRMGEELQQLPEEAARGITMEQIRQNPRYAMAREGLPSESQRESQLFRERKEERIANNQQNRLNAQWAQLQYKYIKMNLQDAWKRQAAVEDLQDIVAGYQRDIIEIDAQIAEAKKPGEEMDPTTGQKQMIPPDYDKIEQLLRKKQRLETVRDSFRELQGQRQIPTSQGGWYEPGSRGVTKASPQGPQSTTKPENPNDRLGIRSLLQ